MSESEDTADLLTVDQAISIIDNTPVEPRLIDLPLQEAQGLRLAQDLPADRDYPPFDKALMDGFAVRCEDVATLPAELALVGEIAAGSSASRPLEQGEAMAIMTGAPLPPGADGVVPVEDVASADVRLGGKIRILRADSPGRYVSTAGSDARAGAVLVPAGAKLDAAQLAVAASVGAARVKACAAPRVAVISTGDEIVPFNQTPVPAQIRGCNGIMLTALLRRLDCRPVDLGLLPDRRDAIRQALIKGMQLDAVAVSGGMSMGRYDFVPTLLAELGVEMKITKLRIKPGKSFVFGIIDRAALARKLVELDEMPLQGNPGGACYVFGLPGNPVSAFVCTVRLVSRLLDRLAGGRPEDRWLAGRLGSPLAANGPREFYQPATLERNHTGLIVHPMEWKGSADIFTLANADALLPRRENEPAQVPGVTVSVLEI